jgi:hypothetical protein
VIESIGQETLLAVPWLERALIYSNTGEEVLRLKHPLEGDENDAIMVDTSYTGSGMMG